MAKKQARPANEELDNDVCDYFGIIRDEEIKLAIAKDLLLTRASSDLDRVRQASYELRLSKNVEFLKLSDADGAAHAKYERPANGIGHTLSIMPGSTVKIFVEEVFNLPTNVVAHVFPIGNIYKLGLSPETTYGDPGYDGDFYIIICNYSPRIVELTVGDPIARVEFIRLAKNTTSPHPGSDNTNEPTNWPRRVDRREKEALVQLGLDHLLDEVEGFDPPHFEHAIATGEVKRQLESLKTGITADLDVKQDKLDAFDTKLEALNSTVRRNDRNSLYLSLMLAAIIGGWLLGTIWHHIPEQWQANTSATLANAAGSVIGAVVIGSMKGFNAYRKSHQTK